MFGYRHAFHAGNFADVVKHSLLVALLEALQRKDTPLCVLDTHAGLGRYDLASPEACKNREYAEGIGRVYAEGSAPPAAARYLELVRALNAGGSALRWYPGSPRIARALLRPQDRLVLTELNRADHAVLKREFAGDRQVAVHLQDAYQGLKAFLPPAERRGLVLIDPAYELKDEYERAAAGLAGAHRRWPTGVYALWYPLLTASLARGLHEGLRAGGIRKVLRAELWVRPEARDRLSGSGMLIVNPPWRLEAELAELLPWLQARLCQLPPGEVRVDWLVPE